MSKSWVLKLPRLDGDGYLLLRAFSSSDSALDLNLLATEGEAPYRGKGTLITLREYGVVHILNVLLVRQRKIKDLRAKNFHGSDDEWQNILLHVFNPQSAASLPEDKGKGLEIVAAIGNGKVTITLRNRIDKITQRLGSIELSQDDDAEIQLFDWCGSSIDQRSILQAEQSELRVKYESAQANITSLNAKLEELVKAKADHEEELISKFVLLLNEKKSKIRNQQRLLSTAKVDQKKLQQMQKTLDGKGRRAESIRAGKRRADANAGEGEAADNDSSDAFENMDVDQQAGTVAESQEGSSERQTTPETETAIESDGASAPDPAPGPSPATKPTQPTRGKTSKQTTTSLPGKASMPRLPQAKNASPPPPVGQLPFAKKGAKAQKAAQPEREAEPLKPQTRTETWDNAKANDSDKETDSDDDDEL